MTNQGFNQLSKTDKRKLEGQVLFLRGNDLESVYRRSTNHVKRTQAIGRTSKRS